MKRIISIAASLFSVFTVQACAADLKPGLEFQDCKDCPVMVVIPKGEFTFGRERVRPVQSPKSLEEAVNIGTAEAIYSDLENKIYAMSIKKVDMKKFAIGKYEITHDEYMVCFKAGGCKEKPIEKFGSENRLPAVGITWFMARDYVRWLSKKTGRKYRLPSSAEWEYAAKAGTHTVYWWGTEMEDGRALCRTCFKNPRGMKGFNSEKATFEQPYDVGSFAPNPFGLYDMLSNVSEWTQDCVLTSVQNLPADGRAYEPKENCDIFTSEKMEKFNGFRVIRGGDFGAKIYRINVDRVSINKPEFRRNFLGFRIVAEIQ